MNNVCIYTQRYCIDVYVYLMYHINYIESTSNEVNRTSRRENELELVLWGKHSIFPSYLSLLLLLLYILFIFLFNLIIHMEFANVLFFMRVGIISAPCAHVFLYAVCRMRCVSERIVQVSKSVDSQCICKYIYILYIQM